MPNMLYRRILFRDLCGCQEKKGETTGVRKYVRFYHFDPHTYSSRDVCISFYRTMCLMLAMATRWTRKTSCHDTATGGGINYLSSRTAKITDGIPLPKKRDFEHSLRATLWRKTSAVFLPLRMRQKPDVRFIYIPNRINNRRSQTLSFVRDSDIATWFFRFNVLCLIRHDYHIPCVRRSRNINVSI